MIKKITVEKALTLQNSLLIDARSPKEYHEDHLQGAINLPLLNDQERHEVGLIYKQISREKAIEKGMHYFAPKVPTIYNVVKNHSQKNIVLYCARGGMRSGIIASLLDSLGFKVYQIEGGYKSFRNYMVKTLYNFPLKPKVVVLWGLTCTGKTALLHQLPNSLDLEELAQHRGSLMGHLGLQSNSQKKFENLLLQRLQELNREEAIFIEGESRRIGDVIIPEFLYKAMLSGTPVLVTRSLQKRVEAMSEEYFKSEHLEEIKKIVKEFSRLLSNKQKSEIIKFIDETENLEAAKIILQYYYDPLYEHTLKNFKFVHEVNNDDVRKAVKDLKTKVLT